MIFNQGANIVGVQKDISYLMTCAWAMQADENKVLLLIGSQSVTGNAIEKGDVIGVSVLKDNQKDIAVKLGENHSDEINKLSGLDYYFNESAILIRNSKNELKLRVENILDLFNNSDKLLVCEVLEMKQNEGKYLSYEEFL